jgi:hypothetical protein
MRKVPKVALEAKEITKRCAGNKESIRVQKLKNDKLIIIMIIDKSINHKPLRLTPSKIAKLGMLAERVHSFFGGSAAKTS